MNHANAKLADVLREAVVWLQRPDNDFAWSPWNNEEEAVAELSAHIATLETGTLPPELDLWVLFAPTGPIQEVSVSSGWGDDFLSLAERFDRAVRRGRCPACGYDLRATPGRCPECGTAAAAVIVEAPAAPPSDPPAPW